LSPETFLVQSENQLKTYPIKGTGTKDFLEHSEKEISELHMITDLMRNDLGKICNKVWLERERYLTEEAGFYHARAEVCGTLAQSALSWKDYKELLPAGSISGAPKARVLKLLKTAESFDRGFYTGTFGVRLSPQKSIFNILIRTLFIDAVQNTWNFPVGAGITIESDPKSEWQETLQKAQILKDCVRFKPK
jgi:para-aminobenzoate synthetase component 1